MAANTVSCTILTPERTVLKTEATLVVLPAYDGEVGILHNRAPLLCRLGIGVVRLESDGKPQKLFVDAGFAEVRDNVVTILTPQALAPKEIDASAARAAGEEARHRPAHTQAEQETRRKDIERAAAKLKLAS